jgi:predicted nucleic acid-binding protein
MKVILDTNVFASGIFWNGIPAKILKLWQAGQFILYLTPDIFEEYILNLNNKILIY